MVRQFNAGGHAALIKIECAASGVASTQCVGTAHGLA